MSENDCMVSVLCAAFNHEEYIASALESFLAQKCSFKFEVLVNDDKSSDRTAEIIRSYAEKYPDIIRPIYQETNLFSLKKDVYEEFFYPQARGRYVALCEGDDYWSDPEKLQLQVDFLEAHPEYSACVHNTVIHDCSGKTGDRSFVPVSQDRDVSFEEILQGMSHAYHTSSLMARKEIISDHRDFYKIAFEHGFGDYPDALRLAMEGPVHFIERPMSVYRICSNPHSWSSSLDAQYQKLRRFINGELAMLRALRPQISPERQKACDRVILEREYELMYIEGRVDEMVKPPYDEIYRSHSLPYRAKITLKRLFPGLHRLYRRHQGYK